jgi:3-hydroxyacyl-[acyl-carrier-protein] dehydratase
MEAMEEMFLMTFLTLPGNEGLRTACIKVQSEFKKKIIPGDRLDIESELTSYKRGVVKGSSRGFVNGELACEAELMLAIPDIVKQFMPTNICSI